MRELKTAGGVNLFEDEVALTPEASIHVLQNRVRETQSELDALEDLARRNSIEPRILRGQPQDVPAEAPVVEAKQLSCTGLSIGLMQSSHRSYQTHDLAHRK